MPDFPTETPDTLPPAGQRLAAAAFVVGVAQTVWVHLTWWFDGTPSGNAVGGFLGLYIAYGLVRGHSAARWVALCSAGISFLGAILVVLVAFGVGVRYLAGKPLPSQFDADSAYLSALVVLQGLVAVWVYRTARRPEVTAYCDGKERGRAPLRLQVAHLLLLTLGIAIGLALSHWNPHRVVLNP